MKYHLIILLFSVLGAAGCGGGAAENAKLSASEPLIQSQPHSVAATSGQSVTFSVDAAGTQLIYEWFKDGALVSNATSPTLTLPGVCSKDIGEYHVIVSNADGAITSDDAALTIIGSPPSISSQPISQVAASGSDVELSILAVGDSLKYQWVQNDRLIPDGHDSTLNIKNFDISSVGNYYVIVSNCSGSVSSATALVSLAT